MSSLTVLALVEAALLCGAIGAAVAIAAFSRTFFDTGYDLGVRHAKEGLR